MSFYSTKRFGPISTGHRQWKHNGHCSFAHGYGRIVKIIFGGYKLDEKGWVVDFGALKPIKQFLEQEWDHRLLLAADDPLLEDFLALHEKGGCNINVMHPPYGPGIELSCAYVFDFADTLVIEGTNGRCWVQSVEIWEHENNSAIYERHDELPHWDGSFEKNMNR